MLTSTRGRRGMAVAPHALAAQSALDVLREGGNAIEATIAAAATIAVVYPHMNSIGGDSFWLMHVPGHAPGAIDACGAAAARGLDRLVSPPRRRASAIPFRGGLAANTVAGTVSGWGARARAVAPRAARAHAVRAAARRRDLLRGSAACRSRASQAASTAKKAGELKAQPGYAKTFLAARQGAGDRQRSSCSSASRRRCERIARSGRRRLLPRRARARDRERPRARSAVPLALRDLERASRAARRSARVPAQRRHALQHAAADAGPRVAADPRHTRRAPRAAGPGPRARSSCISASKRRSRRSSCATATSKTRAT